MPIRITRSVKPHRGAGPAPISDEISVVDDGPGLVFVRIYRSAYAIAAEIQPAWMDAGRYPLPDGLPWSKREITLTAKGHAQVQQLEYLREYAYSERAWLLRKPGSRYWMQLETMDAGFVVTWTLEHL